MPVQKTLENILRHAEGSQKTVRLSPAVYNTVIIPGKAGESAGFPSVCSSARYSAAFLDDCNGRRDK